MSDIYRMRRIVTAVLILVVIVVALILTSPAREPVVSTKTPVVSPVTAPADSALSVLQTLAVKGRAPKTGYARTQFGDGWATVGGCDTRDIILHRDLQNVILNDKCEVTTGTLNDPYTGKVIDFIRGPSTSSLVQIDHVVAISNAWQTGAQQLTADTRETLANDPLELLAVDGAANQQKSDGDAATWLPPNKSFRCQYVARQVAVKQKYHLWVTAAEKQAIMTILTTCPTQALPSK
jgi:hypothetical protein